MRHGFCRPDARQSLDVATAVPIGVHDRNKELYDFGAETAGLICNKLASLFHHLKHRRDVNVASVEDIASAVTELLRTKVACGRDAVPLTEIAKVAQGSYRRDPAEPGGKDS